MQCTLLCSYLLMKMIVHGYIDANIEEVIIRTIMESDITLLVSVSYRRNDSIMVSRAGQLFYIDSGRF